MKFNKGNWVIVTKRYQDGSQVEHRGKVIEATRDYAVAECWTSNGVQRFTLSDDTASIVFFRRAAGSDFRRR
jgi:hypothetical protein